MGNAGVAKCGVVEYLGAAEYGAVREFKGCRMRCNGGHRRCRM